MKSRKIVVRIYLFNYTGANHWLKSGRLYWTTQARPNNLGWNVFSAARFCQNLLNANQITGFHIVTGDLV